MNENWLDAIRTKLQEYPDWLFDVGIFGVMGFVFGFVMKTFGRIILFGCIGLVVGLSVLHYSNIVVVNVVQIKSIAGLASANTIDDALRIYSEWAKLHAVGLLAGVVSFCIGWKVG